MRLSILAYSLLSATLLLSPLASHTALAQGDVEASAHNSATFHGQAGFIPDYNGEIHPTEFPIVVGGLPSNTGNSFGLEKVCFSIMHPKVSDLKVELISPDGTSIWISNRNGGDTGVNYIATCVEDNAFKGYFFANAAPFMGSFHPDGRLTDFNNGQDPNGTWILKVTDLAFGNYGRLTDVSITLGNQPAQPLSKFCNRTNGLGCRCPDGDPACELLPDLIVSSKMTREQYQEYPPNDPTYPSQLRVAASTANVGYGPLEVRGTKVWTCGNDDESLERPVVCPDGRGARQMIEQIVYKKNCESITFYSRPAGTNYFDSTPGHNHFHADDWIEISLRKPIAGEKDPKKWQIMGKSNKVSYCLFDSGNCTDENEFCQKDNLTTYYGFRNLPNYGFGHYIQCESYLQGISVGGVDTYGMHYEGQSVDLPPDICNGDYVLMIEVNPTGRYRESRTDNNYILQPITLTLQKDCGGGAGK